ncbi:PREDICTED: ribonuclease [Prunus dulcis]|uniref:PREDICTED: ribonuclease n=1 Tax=Prunus dulcis TaxID=3755 RepID=A0A5E4EI03_PRUDU|nr:PREDICTED: ribonuclease [Prunus dulcis]
MVRTGLYFHLQDQVPVSLAWELPAFGCFKLNVDGSCGITTGAIGAGGVIRNSVGEWIAGFVANIGNGQILDAEILGLAFGLKLAVDRGVSNLTVEMDSTIIVQLIQSPDAINFHPLAAVICECRELMEKIDNCVVRHIFHEQNCVVDCLANSSYNGDLGWECVSLIMVRLG